MQIKIFGSWIKNPVNAPTQAALLILVLTLALPSISKAEGDLANFEARFNQIFKSLDSIITHSEKQHETVSAHFDFVKKKIYNNELRIVYDSTLPYDIFEAGAFNIVGNEEKVNLSYGRFIIDKYDSYPTLIYAILLNTFQLAYDYYTNHDLFMISRNNNIERTYFEMDALTIEAIFLYVYLKDDLSLGILEEYLISDLSDQLNGTAILLKRTDLQLLHTIDGLKSQDEDARKLLKEFEKIGKELIRETSFDSESEWTNYCSLISLRTYVFYSQQVIFDIVHKKNGVTIDDFKLEDYPDNYEVIKKIQNIMADNHTLMNYRTETIQLFSQYYKN